MLKSLLKEMNLIRDTAVDEPEADQEEMAIEPQLEVLMEVKCEPEPDDFDQVCKNGALTNICMPNCITF
jgi:hypothetical protein